MVSRSLTLAFAGLILVVSARADLNLTPKLVAFDGEGITFQHLVFSDGSRDEITYQQPDGWQYSGSATKLTLHPPNKAQAEGTITRVSLSQPVTFDEETMKQLVKQALAAVHDDSTDLTLVSQEKNPVKIGGKETFLVIISYMFYGERFERSIMFLNRDSEQICFQFVSRAADFEDLQRVFLGSQFTWYNL
jgi:hypothetical protein